MFNSAIFRIAFLLSLSIHLFALSAGHIFHKPAEHKKPEIEVTYIISEASKYKVSEKFIDELPKKYDLKKKETKSASQKKATPKDSGITKADVRDKDERYVEEKELRQLEDYIQYYELIRQEIKQKIDKNYTARGKEGRVEIVFTLNRFGVLRNIDVDEENITENLYLRSVALKSVKVAAPFPAFPSSLGRKELTFSIAIIFRKK